jgi:hypothetical protein
MSSKLLGRVEEIHLVRSGTLLDVIFSDAQLDGEYRKGGPFRRRYGCPRGVAFTFEKSEKGFFLYVGFDRYKDPEVLSRIADGKPVPELQTLSRLAHLPRAKIFVSGAFLPDGRNVDLMDTVGFELRKVWDGVWQAGGAESEVDRLRRQMRLNNLKDALPGIYIEQDPDTVVAGHPGSDGSECIFADRVTEFPENRPACGEPAPERALEAQEQEEVAPQADAPGVPEERDPSEIAACDGCDELFYERQLIEIKPGLYVCKSCGDDYDMLTRLGLTPDETASFARLIRCDWCGQPLTEVEPGRWLCHSCFLLMKEAPPSPIVPGFPVRKQPASPGTEVKDDSVRWLKFKSNITIKPGRVVPAGTVVLGRPGPKLTYRSIPWDEAGVGWRVDLEDGHSTIVPYEAVEEIKPVGVPAKYIPRPKNTPERLATARTITLNTAVEFSPGVGYKAGTRGPAFPVPGGWVIDFAGDQPSALIPDSAVDVGEPIRKLDELRWLECKVDVPIGEGKSIPAGKLIAGSRVAGGWKVGAEYSDFIEDVWRTREKIGSDNSNIVKVDVTPSMVIPDSMVEAKGRARWSNDGPAGKTAPPVRRE